LVKKAPKKPSKRDQKIEDTILDYVGRFADRINAAEIPELIMYGGCGYFGYKAFGNTFLGAVIGMVGLKLATAPAAATSFSINTPIFGVEVPVSSQIAGLAILTAIGVANIWTGERTDEVIERLGNLSGAKPGEYDPVRQRYKLPPWI